MLDIFSYTQDEYSTKIYALLGKGKQHAARLYRQWFQERQLAPETWAEPQARAIVQAIVDQTDFSYPPISHRKEEGKTAKFLLRLSDGLESESVVIPMKNGMTLCLSSQIGCQRGCTFCETGRMGLLRNLSVKEIVAQVFAAPKEVRNIVFMGMGEPLDNFDGVLQAIRILTQSMGFGPRRITVSTSGVVPGIYRLIQEADPAINLAISINAPQDGIRNKIMPINRRWKMEELKQAMSAYCAHPRRQILIEYVLLHGINDTPEDADTLANYLAGLKVKINLIPYNAQSCHRFLPPPLETQEVFKQRLRSKGYRVLLRHHKGRQIMAACGQLGNLEIKSRKSL
jgi:23S rRNA (adenine2503-C2)-methyltransferase